MFKLRDARRALWLVWIPWLVACADDVPPTVPAQDSGSETSTSDLVVPPPDDVGPGEDLPPPPDGPVLPDIEMPPPDGEPLEASVDATTDGSDDDVVNVDVPPPPPDVSVDAGDGSMSCPPPLVPCGDRCVDLTSDTTNCGACAAACPRGVSCAMGRCACPTGQTLCNGACVDTSSDTANCGRCGSACSAGQTCTAGACGCGGEGRALCGTGASAACVDTRSDNAHCGRCDNACGASQTCVMGACACPMGQTRCDGACVDTATSAAHCGRCGNACGAGTACVMGACACPAGQTACGASCVNLQSDASHCGMCGRACAGGQVCVAGACACPAGQVSCTTAGTAVCVDLQTSNAHCGMCGRACPTGQSCSGALCVTAPPNDTRARAIAISVAAPAVTINADTTNASNHTSGPAGCGCSAGRDLFYTFTLTREEVVYADTLDGQSWDSALFLQDATGANLTAGADFTACSNDACGTTRSQVTARLAPGQYYLVLSGCGQGRATVRFQHLPTGSGTLTRINPALSGTQTVSGTVVDGTGRVNGGCGSTGPENMYFFTTCPSFASTRLHLATCNGAIWDTVLHQHSPGRAPVTVCNNDLCGLQSSLDATLPAGAGLHAWYLDSYAARPSGPFTLRYAFGACATDFALCGANCRPLQTDNANCGMCGVACTSGATCARGACTCPTTLTLCGNACANLRTSAAHCGMCGRECPRGALCVAGGCTFSTSTRDAVVMGAQTINATAASVNGAAGGSVVITSNAAGTFATGDLVVLHQTQRAGGAAGYYEYRRVQGVTATGLVLDSPLANTYTTSEAPFARAQVVRVEEVRNLSVPAGASLSAPAWNGNTGGILAITASGTITVAGTVSMDGRGFRGRSHPCRYRCARGYQGEGTAGLGAADIVANANGGGGGGAGQDDASGGGGGHGAVGTRGGNGSCGTCREACPIPGGAGGDGAGVADLSGSVSLGGAGGEGGADEDGGNPGAGGHGGGIVLVRAAAINVTGLVATRGADGVRGAQAACGGAGCGMGGGGGGAGGAVRLQAITSVTLATNAVQVAGGVGAGSTCNRATGGGGSVGRIGINAPTLTGTTTPAADRN